jgi:serine/threonine protein kinase
VQPVITLGCDAGQGRASASAGVLPPSSRGKLAASQSDQRADALSKHVGTELYMAPEVRQGVQYGPKVDMFSVGIITVELWTSFATDMERVQTLRRCHDGVLPESMLAEHPLASKLAATLLQTDASLRPGAAEVPHHSPTSHLDRRGQSTAFGHAMHSCTPSAMVRGSVSVVVSASATAPPRLAPA